MQQAMTVGEIPPTKQPVQQQPQGSCAEAHRCESASVLTTKY